MSRFSKLVNSPRAFFIDALNKRLPAGGKTIEPKLGPTKSEIELLRQSGKPTAVLVGFSDWKKFMIDFLPDYNVVFLGHNPNVTLKQAEVIRNLPSPTLFVWSYKYPSFLKDLCQKRGIEIIHVEDAFVRSFGLGVARSKPLSLVFDKKAMHFDRSSPSELEYILANYDFDADTALMNDASSLYQVLKSHSITKYNSVESGPSLETIVNRSASERILVLGQVEDDLSMKFGSPQIFTGNDLVTMAAIENPDAQILYRPHPESLAVSKKHYSNPQDVAHICEILPKESTLHECFAVATKVYTVTSLAGFEALLYGLPVKLFGNPFYGGWGLTEDANPIDRRGRTLSLMEVLAAAYIKYPKYYHPVTNVEINAIEAVQMLTVLKAHAQAKSSRENETSFWDKMSRN